ncbi:MAG: hypothetical protein ACKO96_05505, partial [Flammeovirgaceae bacterium]
AQQVQKCSFTLSGTTNQQSRVVELHFRGSCCENLLYDFDNRLPRRLFTLFIFPFFREPSSETFKLSYNQPCSFSRKSAALLKTVDQIFESTFRYGASGLLFNPSRVIVGLWRLSIAALFILGTPL